MYEEAKKIIRSGLFAAAIMQEIVSTENVHAQESSIQPPRSTILEAKKMKPFKKIPPEIGLGLLGSAILISAGMRYTERKK